MESPLRTFFAYIEYDLETRYYFGVIPSIHGAHTQGDTLEELRTNLKEVLELCLEEYDEPLDDMPQFVGLWQIEVDT